MPLAPWVSRCAALSALGLLLGLSGPVSADEAAVEAARAKALADTLAPLPLEAAPLRVRVTWKLPKEREPRSRDRMAYAQQLLESIAFSAGFAVQEDGPGTDSPLLLLDVQGTEAAQEGQKDDKGKVTRAPALVAQVRATLSLHTQRGPGWQVPLEGRAARALGTASEVFTRDAPWARALGNAGLMSRLIEIVDARKRDGPVAVLRAYADMSGAWASVARAAVGDYDQAQMAKWLVELLPEERGVLGQAASDLLPDLGDAALEPLLAAPREGGIVYRWRRLVALRSIEPEGPAAARVAAELRHALRDRSVLLQIAALRGLAEVEGARSGETLLAALADPRPSLAQHARLALAELSGQDHGLDVARWRAWLASAGGSDATTRPGATRDAVLLLPFGVRPRRGPSGATEAKVDPVASLLARLAKAQRPDGTWPLEMGGMEGYEAGVSATCLLAFFAAGHGFDDDGPHARTIERGVAALVAAQEQGPSETDGFVGARTVEGVEAGHALSTLALLNAWSVKPTPVLRDACRRAVRWIVEARNPYFGWRYGTKPGDNDSFVTATCALALRAAQAANTCAQAAGGEAPFPFEAGEAFEGVQAWFDKMSHAGHVGYVMRGTSQTGYVVEGKRARDTDTPSTVLTAGAALHALLQGAKARDARLAPLLAECARMPRAWPPTGEENDDLLGWWLGSMAMARVPKEKEAKAWESGLAKALPALLAASDEELGARARWGGICGPSFCAALAVLTATAKDFLPPLEAGRADLLRVAQDARTPASMRRRAALAWALQAPLAKATAQLGKWIADPLPELRGAAAEALLERGALTPEHLVGLLKGFTTLPEASRLSVVRVGERSAHEREEARTLLVQALGDPQPAVRTAAARSWPRAVPLPDVARGLTLEALGLADAEASSAALELLAQTKPAPSFAQLEQALRHVHPRVRALALRTLVEAAVGTDAERRAALEAGARDKEAIVRSAAAGGLGASGRADAAPLLRTLLADADEGVGSEARNALAALSAAHAPVLESVLGDLAAEAPATRRRAAEVLARVGKAAAAHEARLHKAIKSEVAREPRDAMVLIALAEARWTVTADGNAVGGLLQGVMSATDTPTEALVRGLELWGSMPQLSEQGDDRRVFTERVEHGPIALAMLNAVADHGARGAHHLQMVEWYLARSRAGSEHHAHALVALRRIKGT